MDQLSLLQNSKSPGGSSSQRTHLTIEQGNNYKINNKGDSPWSRWWGGRRSAAGKSPHINGSSTGATPRKRFVTNGSFNVQREGTSKLNKFKSLFHLLVAQSSWKLFVTFLVLYLTTYTFFALLYWSINRPCKLELTGFRDAFYLAVEATSTIGFGLPDPYFAGCLPGVFILTTNVMVAIVFEATCVSVLFHRFTRPQLRSTTIAFSPKAVIRKIKGHFYFMFQVAEQRKHQLSEAHIRCYGMRHEQHGNGDVAYFQSFAMRLQHPNDELGAVLFLVVPNIVVHRIDQWSPFYPYSSLHHHNNGSEDAASSYSFPDVILRAVDADNGSRRATETPFSSSSTSSLPEVTEEAIKTFMTQTGLEVVCLLEGIDSMTSATTQARYSYCAEDIAFNQTFANCVGIDFDGSCVVDFNKFGTLVSEQDTQNSFLIAQSLA